MTSLPGLLSSSIESDSVPRSTAHQSGEHDAAECGLGPLTLHTSPAEEKTEDMQNYYRRGGHILPYSSLYSTATRREMLNKYFNSGCRMANTSRLILLFTAPGMICVYRLGVLMTHRFTKQPDQLLISRLQDNSLTCVGNLFLDAERVPCVQPIVFMPYGAVELLNSRGHFNGAVFTGKRDAENGGSTAQGRQWTDIFWALHFMELKCYYTLSPAAARYCPSPTTCPQMVPTGNPGCLIPLVARHNLGTRKDSTYTYTATPDTSLLDAVVASSILQLGTRET